MPTPDTETLAARLRAVERALTDEDATPDPPTDHHAQQSADPAQDTAGDRRGEHPAAVERRLCRLEAAVQALRAALDEDRADRTPPDEPVPAGSPPTEPTLEESAPTETTDSPLPTSTEPDPAAREERSRRVMDGSDWPDDLEPE